MAGRGPAPADERRPRSKPPERGGWKHAPGVGWQHGDTPKPPTGILKATREAWDTWMAAWYAAFWSPDDLPGLQQMARVFDAVVRGDLTRAAECRLQMDTWGVTPKGQQDRRWRPPLEDLQQGHGRSESGESRYGHLRAVDG